MVQESVSFELQLFLHEVHMIQLCLSNTHQLGAIPRIEADVVDRKAGCICHQDLASGPFPNHDGVLWLPSRHDQKMTIPAVQSNFFVGSCF